MLHWYHRRRAEVEADPIIFLWEIWVSWDTHLLNMRLILQNNALFGNQQTTTATKELIK